MSKVDEILAELTDVIADFKKSANKAGKLLQNLREAQENQNRKHAREVKELSEQDIANERLAIDMVIASKEKGISLSELHELFKKIRRPIEKNVISGYLSRARKKGKIINNEWDFKWREPQSGASKTSKEKNKK